MTIKRSTPELTQALSELVGEGLHVTFRKFCDHRLASDMWHTIDAMDGRHWRAICDGISKSVIQYVIRNPRIRKSARSQNKIAFLIARRSLQVVRDMLQAEPERMLSRRQLEHYVRYVEEMSFAVYRQSLDVLAETVISALRTPVDRCYDCTYMKKSNHKCKTCSKPSCAFHCRCVTATG